jgi:hypothetical protein
VQRAPRVFREGEGAKGASGRGSSSGDRREYRRIIAVRSVGLAGCRRGRKTGRRGARRGARASATRSPLNRVKTVRASQRSALAQQRSRPWWRPSSSGSVSSSSEASSAETESIQAPASGETPKTAKHASLAAPSATPEQASTASRASARPTRSAVLRSRGGRGERRGERSAVSGTAAGRRRAVGSVPAAHPGRRGRARGRRRGRLTGEDVGEAGGVEDAVEGVAGRSREAPGEGCARRELPPRLPGGALGREAGHEAGAGAEGRGNPCARHWTGDLWVWEASGAVGR